MQAFIQALPGRRGQGIGSPSSWPGVESQEAGGIEASGSVILRAASGGLWSDAGGGETGGAGLGRGSRDAAALVNVGGSLDAAELIKTMVVVKNCSLPLSGPVGLIDFLCLRMYN